MTNRWGLQMAFDTDDPQFVRGFEAGSTDQLAKRLAAGEDHLHGLDDAPGVYTQIVHATNAEMMLRIAESRGLHVQSEEMEHGWLQVTFRRVEDTP